MSKLIFILGGARSGKSSFAQSLAERSGKSATFIATAQALDGEMSTRIKKHQGDRPADWVTLEIPFNIPEYLQVNPIRTDTVLLDCVTLLVSNLLMRFTQDDLVDAEKTMQAVDNEIDQLLSCIAEHEQDWIVISNEVGLGIVPAYQMGRVYRDLLGKANQRLARAADEVYWMAAGIAVPIHQYRNKAHP